jgi:hypothetical protein
MSVKTIRFTETVETEMEKTDLWQTIGRVDGEWKGISDPGPDDDTPTSAEELRVFARLYTQAADECDRLNAVETKPKVRKFKHRYVKWNYHLEYVGDDPSTPATLVRDNGVRERDILNATFNFAMSCVRDGDWVEITDA